MQTDRTVTEVIRRSILQNGWIELPSEGSSMFPFITQGSICRFCLSDALPQKGDILLYISESGALIGHRLQHTLSDGTYTRYVCKGDSNVTLDEPITKNQIIGKLTEVHTKSMLIKTNHPLAVLWGKLILHIPMFATCIHHYLGFKRSLRHKKI